MAIASVYNAVESALRDRTGPWSSPFVWLEGRTGIGHPKLLAGCVLAALALVVASGRTAMLVSNLLGFAYPMYATVELMMLLDGEQREAPSPVPDEQPPVPAEPPVPTEQPSGRQVPISPATRWLAYWVTFSAVLIVQQLCGEVLQIIPFYFLAKIVFFVWCALPMEANGAAFVHRFVVRNYLKRFFN